MKRRKRKLTAILNQIGRERGLRGWLSVDFLKASDVALGHSRRFWHVRGTSAYPPLATEERDAAPRGDETLRPRDSAQRQYYQQAALG